MPGLDDLSDDEFEKLAGAQGTVPALADPPALANTAPMAPPSVADDLSDADFEALASTPVTAPTAPAAVAAPAQAAPAVPPGMVELVKNGQRYAVPEFQALNEIGGGAQTVEDYEGAEAEAALQAEYGTLGGKAMALAQAVPRGLTFGASDTASAALTGSLLDEGPRLTPEAEARAKQLGLKVEPKKSAFDVGYEAARNFQQNLAKANPTTAVVGEIAGAVAPALLSGGTSALAYTPAALAERAGAKVGAKVLGEAATAGIGRKALAGAATGAVEGALQSGGMALSEEAMNVLADPLKAAEHVALATSEGALIGGVLGGVLHAGGAALERGSKKLDDVADGLAPKTAEEVAAEAIDAANMDEITLQLEAKPANTNLEEIAAADTRAKYAKLVEQEQAANGAFDEVLDRESRATSEELSEYLKLQDEIDEHAGIAAKREINDAAARNELVEEMSGRFEDVGEAVAGDTLSEGVRREMSVRHAAAEDLLDHIEGAFSAYREGLSDLESNGLGKIMKHLGQKRPAVTKAFREGNLGEAYNLVDQAVKGALGRARNSLGSDAQGLIEAIYPTAKNYLENPMWGSLAERQKLVNPSWSARIGQSLDSLWGQFKRKIGNRAANDWDNLYGADEKAVGALLAGVGDHTQVGVERAFNNNIRAGARDAVNRAQAFGTPELQAKAARMVELAASLEKRVGAVAKSKADMIAGQRAAQAGSTADLLSSAIGFVSPRLAFAVSGTAVAKRKVIAAVAESGSAMTAKVAKNAAKLARATAGGARAAAKVAPKASGVATQAAAQPVITDKKYEKAIQEATALSDPQSPQTRALFRQAAELEKESPEFADAYVKQLVTRAQFIANKLPKQRGDAVFRAPPVMDKSTARKLQRYVSAAYYPERALDRLGDGTATPEDVEVMRVLYPGNYQDFVTGVAAELEARKTPVKGQQAQRLHMLTGLPVTPDQEPANIAKQQAMFAADPSKTDVGPEQDATGKPKQFAVGKHIDPNTVFASRVDRLMTGQ